MEAIGKLDHAGNSLEIFECNSKPIFKLDQVEAIIGVDYEYFLIGSQTIVNNLTVTIDGDVYITARGVQNLFAMIYTRDDRCNNAINWISNYAIPESTFLIGTNKLIEQENVPENAPAKFDYRALFKNLLYWLVPVILGILLYKIIMMF